MVSSMPGSACLSSPHENLCRGITSSSSTMSCAIPPSDDISWVMMRTFLSLPSCSMSSIMLLTRARTTLSTFGGVSPLSCSLMASIFCPAIRLSVRLKTYL